MHRMTLLVTAVAAVISLALLFPVACEGTAIGIPEGGPDPNGYSCESLVIDPLAMFEGPTPGTDQQTTGLDVLKGQLTLRASLVVVAVGAVGIGLSWAIGRRAEVRSVST